MRDQPTSNREAELTAPPRIGSGDWLDSRFATHEKKIRKTLDISVYVAQYDDCEN